MRTKANREEGALSNAPPPRADTGGPGPVGHGRVLAYTRSGEDRRKGLGLTFTNNLGGLSYWRFNRWAEERRSGKERRDTLIAPDDECVCGEINARNCPVHGGDFPEGLFDGGYGDFGATADHDDDTAEQHDAEAERWHERHYPSGVSDRAVVRCDKPPSQCGEYGGTHQPGRPNAFCDCRCHDTIDSAEDIDYESVDFVHSILQAEIDRDLLTRAQYPSYRRDEHEHAGLGVPPVQGERWGLFHRWGRALRRRIPSSSFYVASPGLQWGSERGPTGGAR